LLLAESQWAAGQREVAVNGWKQLVSAMRDDGSTKNWTYHQTTEWLAVAAAESGNPSEALSLLDSLDRTPKEHQVLAPSHAERADSTWRRATALLAAGERDRARALLATMQADLQGQHPDSPRLPAVRRLQAALEG
jgi:hypothetical protein